MEIIRKNKEDLVAILKDSDGNLIDTTLLTDIKFAVKETNYSTSELFIKSKSSNEIEVSDAEKSIITIHIKSADTDQAPKTYVMGLRLFWQGGDSTEMTLLDINDQPDNTFKILPNIVSS